MVDALFRMRFVVPELWIGIDAIGATFELEWDGAAICIRLPRDTDSFSGLPSGYRQQPVPSLVASGPVFGEPDRDVRTAALLIFEVTMEVASNFPAVKPAELTPEVREIADGDIDRVRPIVERVASMFVRHLRAAAPQQSWLGLSAHAPDQYGIAQLEYRDTGERILGYGPRQSVTMRSSRLRLDFSDIERIVADVAVHQEPDIADSLLADAWHLADAQAANDQDRATLVTATACEVRVKQVIQDRVPASGREMAKLILRRRSNLPELLHEVLLATLGVSLKTEDLSLFRMVEELAAQRNAIVHAGRRHLGATHLNMPAQIGSSLFAWLESLPANHEGMK